MRTNKREEDDMFCYDDMPVLRSAWSAVRTPLDDVVTAGRTSAESARGWAVA
ncbi:hypothetical protein [Saccharopolyspora taberi]|uniref:hypothetical protein n=1 Tax=Saccharopolyspora taberi TaxID=60895 RepID=UPI0031D0E69C